ncbi:MAG: Hpt domain-containing protein [Acidobacteria bacterium]|nr:Hpt domain-containing protein [Acidobacteriota bacterium]
MANQDSIRGGSALDRELALSRVGGDLELLQEIALLFLSDSERMAREIESSVQARDPKALDRSAHTLKGCVSNFGAQRLYELSLALERMGRAGDLTNVDPVFNQLKSEINQLESDLRHLTAEK